MVEMEEEVSLSREKRQVFQGDCPGLWDIVVVLDSSGSIRDRNPPDGSYDNWQKVLEFIRDLANSFTISSQNTQIGLVEYSNSAKHIFKLNEFENDKNGLLRKILDTGYIGGTTNTAEGIEFARDQQFVSFEGDRSFAPNLMIVITDGESNVNAQNTIPEAERAHAAGIEVISIGITDAINANELRGISSPPHIENENWWLSEDFTTLSEIQESIVNRVCLNGGGNPTPAPVTPAPIPDNLYCMPTCCYGTMCFCKTQNPTFSVNGTRCRDVDECAAFNGGCETRCQNTEGSYYCSCDSGYQLGTNNHECEDVDECATGNLCPAGTICVNTWGSYHCLSGAFAALTGVETVAATVGGAGSATAMIGIIAAAMVTVINLAVLGYLVARWARTLRSRRQNATTVGRTVQGSTNGAFRAEAGTIRSFNSLGSKFSSADSDSVSNSSTISS